MNFKKLLLTIGLFASMVPAQAMSDIIDYMGEYTVDTAKEIAAQKAQEAAQFAAQQAAQKAKLAATIVAQKAAEAAQKTAATVTKTATEVIIKNDSWYSWDSIYNAIKATAHCAVDLAVKGTEKLGILIQKNPKFAAATLAVAACAAYEYKQTRDLRERGKDALHDRGYFDYNGVRLTRRADIENLSWRVAIPSIPLSPIAMAKDVWNNTAGRFTRA